MISILNLICTVNGTRVATPSPRLWSWILMLELWSYAESFKTLLVLFLLCWVHFHYINAINSLHMASFSSDYEHSVFLLLLFIKWRTFLENQREITYKTTRGKENTRLKKFCNSEFTNSHHTWNLKAAGHGVTTWFDRERHPWPPAEPRKLNELVS